MNFTQSIQTCLKKYVDFTGRASRPELWWFFLAQFILMTILGMIDETLSSIASLGLLLPSLSVAARRLHDIGKSGWWQLIALTVIGVFVLIYWYCQPGKPESNQWGAGPGGATGGPAAVPPGAV